MLRFRQQIIHLHEKSIADFSLGDQKGFSLFKLPEKICVFR